QVKHKNFSPEKFAAYDFSLANESGEVDKIVNEGKTDSKGEATESFTAKEAYTNKGMLQADFYTTVFDETGRPVSRNSSIDIATQNVFFGLGYDWFYYYSLNQPVKFQIAAVNKDGSPVNATATVRVIKHEYRVQLARSGSYFRYESQPDDKT